MPAPPAQPYPVSSWGRTLCKGIVAESLRDLREKVRLAWPVVGTITLVLDNDSTIVETEELFQTLQEGTVFLVLTKGQSWSPMKIAGYQLALSNQPHHRHDVACVTFNLYKTNPEDFIGCLNFKATLYGAYSISYDMRCYGTKRLVKLRCLPYLNSSVGLLELFLASRNQQSSCNLIGTAATFVFAQVGRRGSHRKNKTDNITRKLKQ